MQDWCEEDSPGSKLRVGYVLLCSSRIHVGNLAGCSVHLAVPGRYYVAATVLLHPHSRTQEVIDSYVRSNWAIASKAFEDSYTENMPLKARQNAVAESVGSLQLQAAQTEFHP